MSKQIRILTNYFLGPVLCVVLCYSLYSQVRHQPDLVRRWQQVTLSWHSWKFWLAAVLMLVNWGIESRKWQVLVGHVQQFSFWRAFKSVLSGCIVTMLTPNRVGEYGGRILYVDVGRRIEAISLTIAGSISQLLITMGLGSLGLVYLRYFSQQYSNALNVLPDFWGDILIYLSVSITLIILFFYLRLGWLVRLMEKVPGSQKIVRHIKVLDEFDGIQLGSILSLSFARYLVFVLQYVLMLQVMQVNIDFILCCWLITVFYLVMAVAPTMGFIELPVRVTASWAIFKFFTANELGVGAAALVIWLINLVVPAIIGSILLLNIKVTGKNNEGNY